MTVQLFEVSSHPGRMAISSVGGCVPGGAFFLNFNKPLQFVRGNKFLPIATAIMVPVIHEAENEAEASLVVAVMRWTPMWQVIKKAWKLAKAGRIHTRHVPTGEHSGLKIISDFATQFPEFSQSVKS